MKELRRYSDIDWYIFEHFLTEEDVMILVDRKIIPHYIVEHPITKEVTIMFDKDELKNWYGDNYTRYSPSDDLPEFETNVLLTVQQDDGLESITKIPKELTLTPNLKEFKTASLVQVPCVYFLCKNQKIVYIGQTINIQNRIAAHITDSQKQFDSVFYIHVHKDCLLDVEMSLIRYIRPTYNKGKIAKAKDKDEAITLSILNYTHDKMGPYVFNVIDNEFEDLVQDREIS